MDQLLVFKFNSEVVVLGHLEISVRDFALSQTHQHLKVTF
jgi:hypothetical protein